MSLLQDDLLTRGVLSRRFFAWLVDITVVALLCFSFYLAFLTLGFLTLGLGWTLFGVLPFVPSLYMGLSLVSPMGATPGQALFGLIVARNDDLGPPILAQVVVCVVVYVVTLPVLWISVLLALVTSRRRTLHDLLSGLVVVRRRALEVPLTAGGPHWTMNGSNIPPGSRPAA
jgi:uncharacterized RDD family membrane protein YckC